MTVAAPVHPRHVVHHGTVLAQGLAFALEHPHLKERVLAAWRPGARVSTARGHLVVEFAAPHFLTAETAPGIPLIDLDGALAGAPLRDAERALVAPPDRALVLVTGGVATVVPRGECAPVEPSEWLDVSEFVIEEPLGAAPPLPLRGLVDPGRPPETLFDESVERPPEARTRQQALARALDAMGKGTSGAASTESSTSERAGRARPAEVAFAPLLRAIAPLLHRMLGALAKLGSRLGFASRRESPPALPASVESRTPPGFWKRLQDRLSRWIAHSRLMNVLGRKQAEYLANLLDLLGARKDEDILRHAIPLSREAGSSSGVALLPPQPRTRFELSFDRRDGPSAGALASELYGHLRASYESLFARLEAAERIDEAAFVLAELLDDAARAVAFLERHRRFRLAAELAEGRKLAPGLVVRQWFLAGDRKRAMAIAASTGTFGDAISRLERSGHKQEADVLRVLHAERLATAGRLVEAAQTARLVRSLQNLALDWLRMARELGDHAGVALELELDPNRLAAVWKTLEPWLDTDDVDHVFARRRLGKALVELQHPQGKVLARQLARTLVADAARLGDAQTARDARDLAHYVGGAFSADFPRVVTFEQRRFADVFRRVVTARDAGAREIHDIHRLGSRFLVALGEAGVLLVGRTGKPIGHFDVPAEHLVCGPSTAHVLAVAQRGDVQRLSRIHLGTRRSEVWTEMYAPTFARDFDGETWTAVTRTPAGMELTVLDVVGDEPRVLNRLRPFEDASFFEVNVRPVSSTVLGTEVLGPLQMCRYEMPGWTLRQRLDVPIMEGAPTGDRVFFAGSVAADAAEWTIWSQFSDGRAFTAPKLRCGALYIDLPPGDLCGKSSLLVRDRLFCVLVEQEDRVRVLAGSFDARMVLVDLELQGTKAARARLEPPFLVLGDRAGRIMVIDVPRAHQVVDLRLGP